MLVIGLLKYSGFEDTSDLFSASICGRAYSFSQTLNTILHGSATDLLSAVLLSLSMYIC